MGEDGSALSGEASRARWEGQDKNPKSPQAGPVIEIPRFEEANKRIILPLENAEFGQTFTNIEKIQQIRCPRPSEAASSARIPLRFLRVAWKPKYPSGPAAVEVGHGINLDP